MPEQIVAKPRVERTGASTSGTQTDFHRKSLTKPSFRRHPKLHVGHMNHKGYIPSSQKRIFNVISSQLIEAFYILLLLGTIVFLCLLGAYGSAAIVLGGVLSKAVCRILRMQRPSGYLENNENHDACNLAPSTKPLRFGIFMLGDRGVLA